MKLTLLIMGAILLLVGAGCQSGRVGTSGSVASGGTGETAALGGVGYGHGESGMVDYRQILASPGPFE